MKVRKAFMVVLLVSISGALLAFPDEFGEEFAKAIYHGDLEKFTEMLPEAEKRGGFDGCNDNSPSSRIPSLVVIAVAYIFDDWGHPEKSPETIVGIVQTLMDRGVDVNADYVNGPAIVLAREPEVVQFLLDSGADPNGDTNWGETALMAAAKEQDTKRIHVLAKGGADPNVVDREGNSALSLALKFKDPAVVRALLEAGADPDLKLAHEDTALMIAAGSRFSQSEKGKQAEIMKMLIDFGADVNAQNNSCFTALMQASSKGYTEAIAVLIEAGVDVKFKSKDGYTAFKMATMYGKNEAAELLKKVGAKE